MSLLDTAIGGAHDLGRVKGEEGFLETKAGCLFRLGRYEESITVYRESLALAESLNLRDTQAHLAASSDGSGKTLPPDCRLHPSAEFTRGEPWI